MKPVGRAPHAQPGLTGSSEVESEVPGSPCVGSAQLIVSPDRPCLGATFDGFALDDDNRVTAALGLNPKPYRQFGNLAFAIRVFQMALPFGASVYS